MAEEKDNISLTSTGSTESLLPFRNATKARLQKGTGRQQQQRRRCHHPLGTVTGEIHVPDTTLDYAPLSKAAVQTTTSGQHNGAIKGMAADSRVLFCLGIDVDPTLALGISPASVIANLRF
jgi:hypothetical protein